VKIILAHENADFDAVASILAAHKLFPDGLPVLAERLNRNVAGFLALYANALPFIAQADLPRQPIQQVILVDTHQIPPVRGIRKHTRITVIDHHPVTSELDPRITFEGEVIGANATLLVERLQAASIAVSSIEATLLALGLYEDSGSLSYACTTPRDIRAAAWLVEQGANVEMMARFLDPPLTSEQQPLFEMLIQVMETRIIGGYMIMLGTARLDQVIGQLNAVAHKLMDSLDPTALILVIESPDMINLIARSRDDAVDVGVIAREFGGGGHARAAAAVLRDGSIEDVPTKVWESAARLIESAAAIPRVRDLMSYGVQTVQASAVLAAVLPIMHRIGHEGYPVLDDGRVVGLLTRRDADRAAEHQLEGLTVRDVMMAGETTLTPDDTVATLEQIIVSSGWGQIPVIDSEKRLIGVVTRTDLIAHWAQAHPKSAPQKRISESEIAALLGASTASVIRQVGDIAAAAGETVYLVGGVVRDMLLQRRNLDLDFVVEGDAMAFARQVARQLGGKVTTHSAFGTAKWHLTGSSLHQERESLPETVDFVSARNEYYETPTALPTVYQGSIKLDLRRRDFTINTLALRLSPKARFGEIADYFGGKQDLQNGVIRVLHSLSFVDDPTRILRAIRFEQRLQFTIEPRTTTLMQTATPLLQRVTGERIANELMLHLHEAAPEITLLALEERGVLRAIHPKLRFTLDSAVLFERARERQPYTTIENMALIYWHLWMLELTELDVVAIGERLLLGKTVIDSLLSILALDQLEPRLIAAQVQPSEIVDMLTAISETALLATYLTIQDSLARQRIEAYALQWRHVQSWSSGDTLKALGLPPGPCYGRLLKRLRAARLDGETQTEADEQRLLQELINEGFCDGGS
jgi:tRNA nucleotidyltransferase (CCA-adding enzyme)